jgi:hypothetical protein
VNDPQPRPCSVCVHWSRHLKDAWGYCYGTSSSIAPPGIPEAKTFTLMAISPLITGQDHGCACWKGRPKA